MINKNKTLKRGPYEGAYHNGIKFQMLYTGDRNGFDMFTVQHRKLYFMTYGMKGIWRENLSLILLILVSDPLNKNMNKLHMLYYNSKFKYIFLTI